jgi:zinc transport system ATP-binding protein
VSDHATTLVREVSGASPDDGAALEAQNVSVTLGGAQVLTHVSCRLPRGELSAIIGPNGAGKTTLLRTMLGFVPYQGTVRIGRNDSGRPLRLAYVPQTLDFDRGMPLTVMDFFAAALQQRPLWLGYRRKARAIASRMLERVGGRGWERRLLGKLSGGELQRILLAVAMSDRPEVLLLDEPVSGVDVVGEQMFCDLLGTLQQQEHYTMVLVSHDLSIVTQHAHYVICLNQTVQCQGATVATLTPENLKSLYQQDIGLYTHAGGAHDHLHGHH